MSNFPERFFKYTSATAAVKILESLQVIYRSPIQFNDPFDVQSGLHFDFDIETLPDKILAEIERCISLETRPDLPSAEPFGELVLRMWEMKPSHGFPRERLKDLARPLLVLLKEKTVETQQLYQRHWWDNFLPRLRVFCISEVKDSLLMWSHYSKEHTGVVFEFRVMPDQDNSLCAAKPVQYSSLPPPFFTEKEWLDSVFGVRDLPSSDLYYRYAVVKSEIWSYEKEWRVWDLPSRTERELFSYYPLLPNEIAAVYMGCRINPDSRSEIIRLLAAHPKARAFQARKANDEYKLEFNPI